MIRYFTKKRGQKGFTLIELMIVVGIIAILAAIAIPQFASYRIKSYNTAAASDLSTLSEELSPPRSAMLRVFSISPDIL